MAFILDQILEEVYQAYEALPGSRDPLPLDECGKPISGSEEKARNASFRVIWMLQGGSFGSPKLAAAAPKADPKQPVQGNSPHYAALCNYQVWIWQKSNADCWNVMVDILAAMRATVYGSNLGALNFLVPTESQGRDTELGALFILNVAISVPIPKDGTVADEELLLASAETDVKLRNDLAGLETDPPPAADIEFITVEND